MTAGGQGSTAPEQTYLGRVHQWLLSLGEEGRPVDLTVSSSFIQALPALQALVGSHACVELAEL